MLVRLVRQTIKDIDQLSSHSLGHSFLSELDPTSLTSRTIYRIANEVATISRAECLPSSISSSIFVRSDDSKIPLLKAIITG